MLEHFLPLVEASKGLDLTDPAAAEAALEERFPAGGEAALALNAELKRLYEAGEIANNGEPPMTWGRVSKATDASGGFSIDVVCMNGPGPKHRHPKGEIDYCVALEGEPTFDGRQPGWVVLPEGSVHVPTTAGGVMLIVYLLPEGAFEFVE